MKYALTISERYRIMAQLPQEGDRLTMHDVRDMIENLRPSDKERALFGIVEDAGRISWDLEANDKTVEIDFTTPQVALVVNALQELETVKKESATSMVCRSQDPVCYIQINSGNNFNILLPFIITGKNFFKVIPDK